MNEKAMRPLRAVAGVFRSPVFRTPFFVMVMTLFLVTALTALLLALVNNVTAPEIERLRQQATRQAIEAVLPGAGETVELSPEQLPETIRRIYEARRDGRLLGYAAEAAPMGFGGEIVLMVGILPDGKISGVSVVSMSETPGLGTQVQDEAWFLEQFAGLSDGWVLSRDREEPPAAISGATVSSSAVAEGISDAVEAVLPLLS